MPACWCRARTSRCGTARAAGFPARGHRRGRYCRTARWRKRAGLAPWPALDRVLQDRASCGRLLPSILFAQPTDQIVDVRRHALIDDVVIHGAQLLTDAGFDLAAEAAFRPLGV